MSGLIVRGKINPVPGLTIRSWHDDPLLRLRVGEDCRPSTRRRILSIVGHTTKGIPGGSNLTPQIIRPGAGLDGGEERCARWWSTSPKQAGAQIIIDRDGSVACLADIISEVAFHAGGPQNNYTVGVECYQDSDGAIWQATIDSWVILASFLCDLEGLPRQVVWPYHGGPCKRLDRQHAGRDYRGVYGHRDCASNRGQGDPGDALTLALIEQGGFEPVDIQADEDLRIWEGRQERINASGVITQLKVDGIPGPKTMKAWGEYWQSNVS